MFNPVCNNILRMALPLVVLWALISRSSINPLWNAELFEMERYNHAGV